MSDDRAKSFLQLIRRGQRGRLKIYLGFGPGVGKTYQMLSEAHRLRKEGIDVVVGIVETHGRPETAALVDGLEVLPRRKIEYHGITVEEMDLNAVVSRHPQVVLVDELAHTNAPGGSNAKRYEDVQQILATGIHVITALNVQHLESLYNTVETLVGVKVRERLPDAVLAEADVVVNVDLAAEDLQKRLREGKIYPKERVATSLENFFTLSNLEHLRELTLRELASQIDFKRREIPEGGDNIALDQLMVCLSSRGPNSARLLRTASRLAGKLNRNWYAVYVQTASEDPTVIDSTVQRVLDETLTLANQLGATVFTFKGQDIADTILRFAGEYRVGQIVIGKPHRVRWWRRLAGERSVAEELIHRAKGVSIVVVDAALSNGPKEAAKLEPPPNVTTSGMHAASTNSVQGSSSENGLANRLTERHVLLLADPVSKADVLRRLVATIVNDQSDVNAAEVIRLLEEREAQGSTFLNEGVALPHARVEGLSQPRVALAITKAGVLDSARDQIAVVFLLLSPARDAQSHLPLLSKAARTFRSRDIRKRLLEAKTSAQVLELIRPNSTITDDDSVRRSKR